MEYETVLSFYESHVCVVPNELKFHKQPHCFGDLWGIADLKRNPFMFIFAVFLLGLYIYYDSFSLFQALLLFYLLSANKGKFTCAPNQSHVSNAFTTRGGSKIASNIL